MTNPFVADAEGRSSFPFDSSLWPDAFLVLPLRPEVPLSSIQEMYVWFSREAHASEWIRELPKEQIRPGTVMQYALDEVITLYCSFYDKTKIVLESMDVLKGNFEDDLTTLDDKKEQLRLICASYRDRGYISLQTATGILANCLRERVNANGDNVAAHPQGIPGEVSNKTYTAAMFVQYCCEREREINKALAALGKVRQLARANLEAVTHSTDELSAQIRKSEEELASLTGKITAASEEIDAFKKTVRESISLQAPVEYWKRLRKHHNRTAWGYLVVLGWTLVMLLHFFVYKYMDNLITKIADGQYAYLGYGLVFSTFAIWLIRFCTRMFMTHLSLARDAEERSTITESYLALDAEKNLGESARIMFLNAILRPGKPLPVKADDVKHPLDHDIVSKLLERIPKT